MHFFHPYFFHAGSVFSCLNLLYTLDADWIVFSIGSIIFSQELESERPFFLSLCSKVRLDSFF